LCFTNDILLEYEEIISKKYGERHLRWFLGFISFCPYYINCSSYERHYLIQSDLDDNKFVDSAIRANAKAIMTSDKHFNILKKLQTPSITVLTLDEFVQTLHEIDKKN